MDYTKIKLWLKDNLSEEKYIHSLGTADCARELAVKFNIDEEKAYIAGLLHDCAKCFTKDKLMEIIKEHLDVREDELLNKKTLHAPVSAYIAKNEFRVTDEDILSAIRWHTLGKMDMTDFEKIIFIADKIEPKTREQEEANKVRLLLDEEDGLNKAMYKLFKYTIKSLIKRDLKICPSTISIYNKLQELVQN